MKIFFQSRLLFENPLIFQFSYFHQHANIKWGKTSFTDGEGRAGSKKYIKLMKSLKLSNQGKLTNQLVVLYTQGFSFKKACTQVSGQHYFIFCQSLLTHFVLSPISRQVQTKVNLVASGNETQDLAVMSLLHCPRERS